MTEKKQIRAELAAILDARANLQDAARPGAAARQAGRGRWTVRQALDAIADDGSFVEYGGLVRPVFADMDGPADGLVMGTARVDGRSVNLVLYDYTVYGGSQSYMNHIKISRMFTHAKKLGLPVICWLDGGGARPQDGAPGRRLAPETFVLFAQLSGQVPTVGIVPSRAFAGHANLAGMCDCLIGIRDGAIGLGGPPLVEAAMGVKLKPEEIGPLDAHVAAGVVDIVVEDEAEAIAAAKRYLGYFGARSTEVIEPNVEVLREVVPENRRRAYDVRRAMEGICDVGSILELRRDFARSIVTAFARIDGRSVGVVANQPMHLAGSIDAQAADKAARFTQICDAFGIPVLLLCDTPGLMVGPDSEKTGIVRRSARLLTALANARVPIMTVVLRKAYGLGFYIMGSQALSPAVLLAWPGAEYGGMGLEGAVQIAYGRELEAMENEDERAARRAELLAQMQHAGSSLETAARFLYDDVIDPATTRDVLKNTLETFPESSSLPPRRAYIEPF
ncbi:carboxyl transferase domain-containing protein [Mesorhizobium sp. CAU 1732]|uniref:acyl-CoA carboxylase subunit beta n=1 Tax=Mesorhizobium sp. CAU 1732 TaxID=3140358 RepID=UPI00325FECF0